MSAIPDAATIGIQAGDFPKHLRGSPFLPGQVFNPTQGVSVIFRLEIVLDLAV
jgi:hypothetical protein